MKSILIIILICIAPIHPYEITSVDVLDNIIAQQAAEAQLRQEQSAEIWATTAQALVNLNTALNLTLDQISALYDPTGADLLRSAINPAECQVQSSGDYIGNASLVHMHLCCHIKKMRIPALFLVVSRAHALFHGVDKDDDFGSTSAALQSLQTMQFIDERGAIIAACLDDSGIFVPELAIVRATMTLEVVAMLTESYNSLRLDSQSLYGCIAEPIYSGCNQTTPMLWDQVKPNVLFSLYDPVFIETCDLSSFIAQQNSAACAAFSI